MIVALRGYNTYFDSSRAAGDAEVVVGGLLSTVEEWEQFEISWRLTLAKFDVPYFHMREFNSHSSRGAFKHPKWRTESYRAEFMSHLTQIMRGWAAACIVSSIKKQTFDKYNAAYAVDERFTMFSLAPEIVWLTRENLSKKTAIQSCRPLISLIEGTKARNY